MNEITYIAWKLPEEFTELFLVPMSDLHKGNPFFSEKHLNRTTEYIASKPNVRYVLNGDMLEAATKTSKSNVFAQTEAPGKQAAWVKKHFAPISKQCLGLTSGNHENAIYDTVGVDLCGEIADALDRPYRPEGMLLKISFGGGNERHATAPYVFWTYMTHGWGGARTPGAKAKKVEDQSHYVTADLHIMSHDHVVNVAPTVELQADRRTYPVYDEYEDEKEWQSGTVRAKRVMLVKSNAYLKWGGYAQRLGFPPSDLTSPLIVFLTPKSPMWSMFPERPKQAIKVIV